MPAIKRKPAENNQNSAESSKKSKQEPMELQDIPYGLPRELLEKILSYITHPCHISRVELVNKTFRDICWKSFTSFQLSPTPLPERLMQWFPTLWRKSENLKHLKFFGDIHKRRLPEFLLMVQRLNFEMPRKMESLNADVRFSVCPVLPSLVEAWSASLKILRVCYWYDILAQDRSISDNCVFEMTAFALRKCSGLRILDIDRRPATDVSPMINRLENLLQLRELTVKTLDLDVGRSGHNNAFIGALIHGFRSLWNSRVSNNNGRSKFRLTTHPSSFLGLGAALKQTPAQMDLVTEIFLSDVLEGDRQTANTIGEQCSAAFGCLPRLELFSSRVIDEDESCSTPVAVISSFLGSYSGSSHGVTLELKMGLGDVLEHLREILLGVRLQTKVVGELITDVSGLHGPDPAQNWCGSRSLSRKMSLKFVKGAAQCEVKMAWEG